MHFIAVPATGSHIAPIMDFSEWILIVNGRKANKIHGTKLYVKRLSPRQIVHVLLEAHLKTVICGCLSEPFHDSLVHCGIHVVWGVTGPITTVVEAFAADELDSPRYRVVGLGVTSFKPFDMPLWPCTSEIQKGNGSNIPHQVVIPQVGRRYHCIPMPQQT